MQERRSVNEDGFAQFFGRVYATMGLGMVVTAIVTFLLGYTFRDQYLTFLGSNRIAFYAMTFLPFVFVLMGSSQKSMENPARARLMFLLLAASEGTTLAVFMVMYQATTVIAALLVTAVVFVTMSLVGIFGKKDLSRAGSIAFTLLIGVILISLVNVLLGSTGLSMLINYAVLGIFVVLTAYGTQRLRNLYSYAETSGEISVSALAVQGAMMLYLDFLNLFIAILQIFGIGSSNND